MEVSTVRVRDTLADAVGYIEHGMSLMGPSSREALEHAKELMLDALTELLQIEETLGRSDRRDGRGP